MLHVPKLGNPPPIGTPLDSPEWRAWSREIATWWIAVDNHWTDDAFVPLPVTRVPGGSVPSVCRWRDHQ